jgi:hypothetical protein
LNGITSVPNFMRIYKAVQNLLVQDTHSQKDRQTGDLTSILSFLESGLKTKDKKFQKSK